MNITQAMNINGHKVAKRATEQRIIDALPEGWRLIGINWKKGRVHIVDSFGNKKVKSLYGVG